MVETIGEAMDAGWDIRARCAWGRRERCGNKSHTTGLESSPSVPGLLTSYFNVSG